MKDNSEIDSFCLHIKNLFNIWPTDVRFQFLFVITKLGHHQSPCN